MSPRRYLVVTYDVPSDRRRTRLAKLLQGFLEHVQKSVFEGPLDDGRAERLRRAVERAIERDEDSIRIYTLCRHCRAATEVVGLGRIVEEDPEDIIL